MPARPGCGSSPCSVGGSTPWCSASAALISPAAPGRRHGVADHRLHRPEPGGGPTVVGRAEDLAEALELGAVAGGGGGAVRLDEADRRRVEAGALPRLPQGEHLTRGTRAHEARGAAVAGHAGAADHGVDAVAVALGVGEPLEHEQAGALADQDAVGAPVERPDRARLRQSAQLGEHAPEGEVVAVVHAAGDHQVAATRREQVDRLVDRDERARAGRVDRVRRPLEVEPVGDARGREVRHQADRGLGSHRPELGLELGAHLLEAVGGDLGQQRPQRLHQLLGGAGALRQPRHPGGQVAAATDDHADALRGQPVLRRARVVERGRGGGQGEQLVGLGPVDRDRHDAEPGGVEGGEGVDEAAAVAGEAVGRRGRGVEVHRVPAGGRHLADGVETRLDVLPERRRVGRAGEHAAMPTMATARAAASVTGPPRWPGCRRGRRGCRGGRA